MSQVLLEETSDGEVRWALADHQGSMRDVMDSASKMLFITSRC